VSEALQTRVGLSTWRAISIVATSQVVRAKQSNIYGLYFRNGNAAVRHVKLYDAAAAVDAATAIPIAVFSLAQNEWINIPIEHGMLVTTGLVVRATTGIADNDTGAPSANDVQGFILYK
jgi:hypothetical protein